MQSTEDSSELQMFTAVEFGGPGFPFGVLVQMMVLAHPWSLHSPQLGLRSTGDEVPPVSPFHPPTQRSPILPAVDNIMIRSDRYLHQVGPICREFPQTQDTFFHRKHKDTTITTPTTTTTTTTIPGHTLTFERAGYPAPAGIHPLFLSRRFFLLHSRPHSPFEIGSSVSINFPSLSYLISAGPPNDCVSLAVQ